MLVFCGANEHYYLSLRQFINNISYYLRPCDTLYIVDLGLTANQYKFLVSRPINKKININFVRLDNLDEYPEHCKDLQSYAFKALIFNELVIKPDRRETVVWLDSANLVRGSMLEIELLIHNTKVYSPYSAEDIKTFCHPLTIERMNYKGHMNKDMLSGGYIGIDCKTDIGRNFIRDWVKACLNKDIIIPEGSDKSNHRQDQAVLSILYWQYWHEYGLKRVKEWKYMEFHHNLFHQEAHF